MDNILILFTILIYINPAFDVNISPVVLIFNILGTQQNSKAMRLNFYLKLVDFDEPSNYTRIVSEPVASTNLRQDGSL